MSKYLLVVLSLVVPTALHGQQLSSHGLRLQEAIAIATDLDPWLVGSAYRQEALSDEAVAASSLPDPKMNLVAGNFPVDSFDINQEPMTQLIVGVSQRFPPGQTLSLARQQKEELARREPLLRRDRVAQVSAAVAQLWLEVYRAQETIGLIEGDRSLFEHLVDAARSSYATALGRTRQQDLVRAQLELTRLEDRLTELRLDRDAARRQLSEWLGEAAYADVAGSLPETAPVLDIDRLVQAAESPKALFEWIGPHPGLQAMEQRIEAEATGVDLARQKYWPEWGINAQYGYRDEDTSGRGRADLFTVGVTVDLPLFSDRRQDREVGAAVARAEALKTEKQLLARRLVSELATTVTRLQRLDERRALYESRLLPQMSAQAQASLGAYNSDDGDFAEAVRARIAELDAKIELLSLEVERQQVIARLNYLLAGVSRHQPVAASTYAGETR